jgi:DEAD/DEAH box helicase domain-containing protein
MMDQYYAKNPDDIYSANLENVVLDVENEMVLENHLHCAAAELALHPNRDFSYFGDPAMIEDLCDKSLRLDPTYGVYHADKKYDNRPAKHISIRAIDDEAFRVIDVSTNSEIETVELSRVPFTLYPDAIFIHQGHSFLVIHVQEKAQVARVRPVSVNYATACTDYVNVTPSKTLDTCIMKRAGQPIVTGFGEVIGTYTRTLSST